MIIGFVAGLFARSLRWALVATVALSLPVLAWVVSGADRDTMQSFVALAVVSFLLALGCCWLGDVVRRKTGFKGW
jgi:hypothetical protein